MKLGRRGVPRLVWRELRLGQKRTR